MTPFYLKFANQAEAYAILAKIMIASGQGEKVIEEEVEAGGGKEVIAKDAPIRREPARGAIEPVLSDRREKFAYSISKTTLRGAKVSAYELSDPISKEKYRVEVSGPPPDGRIGAEYYNLHHVPGPTEATGQKDEDGNPIMAPVAGYYMIGLWRGTEKDIPNEFTPYMVEEFGAVWG